METLQELVNLVMQKRVKKVELFDENSRNKASNYFKLFDGIHNKYYQNDQEASLDIYQCEPTEKKYLILKTRLKKKLLNTLFFIDIQKNGDVSDFEIAWQDTFQLLYQAKVLYLSNSFRLAIPYLEKTLQKAQKYAITSIEIECINLLRDYYSQQESGYKNFLSYQEISIQLENRFFAEQTTERYLQELNIQFIRKKYDEESLIQKASEYLKKSQELNTQYDSYRIQYNFLRIKTLYHQIQEDYDNLLKSIKEQEMYLQKNPQLISSKKVEALQFLNLNTFLHQKNIKSTNAFFEKLEQPKIHSNDSSYWYELQEYHLLTCLHTQNFIEAAQVFQKVISQNSFRYQSSEKHKRWYIYQAYLHFFYKSLRIREIRPLIQNSKVNFRLSEFIEQTQPSPNKSKIGLQVSYITAKLLFFLDKLDLPSMRDMVRDLQAYTRRYPQKDMHYRREIFIHMLQVMVDEDFKFYPTRQLTEKYSHELYNTNSRYQGGDDLLEVLPYEVIWQIILEKLKDYRYG